MSATRSRVSLHPRSGSSACRSGLYARKENQVANRRESETVGSVRTCAGGFGRPRVLWVDFSPICNNTVRYTQESSTKMNAKIGQVLAGELTERKLLIH